uniref:Uncharacterized protein n=1 Tax=Daphnia galeata TaxID=27404 RepID=A0A8J2W4K5_9CRUS|nr:unnamed protein product [Daphnia galeata]
MTEGGNTYRPKWKNGGILLSSSVAITIFFLIGLTTSQSSHLKTHVDYRGANLKFVVFHNPPFDTFIRNPNGTFIFYGVALNVLQWMAANFNFTYTLVAVNQTLVDTFGTHEASFYQLINDKVF